MTRETVPDRRFSIRKREREKKKKKKISNQASVCTQKEKHRLEVSEEERIAFCAEILFLFVPNMLFSI